jgi:hypothetical protein
MAFTYEELLEALKAIPADQLKRAATFTRDSNGKEIYISGIIYAKGGPQIHVEERIGK